MKKLIPKLICAAIAVTLTMGLAACGPTHEHSLSKVDGTPSTCSEQGTKTHYACSGCDKLFLDEGGENEVTAAELTLPFAQHEFGDAETDGSQHWFTCKVCEETVLGDHDFVTVTAKQPTATEDGYEAGKVCLACGKGKNGGKVLPKTTLFKSEVYEGLNYCSYEPYGVDASREKLPLVVFLHGSGERGTDNVAQLKNAICEVVKKNSDSEFMKAAVLVPQCPETVNGNEEMWANTPWENGNYNLDDVPESDTNKKVVALINHYVSKGYIDPNRVYVMGISMGGFGAWDLLARHPELFATGVPVCAGGPVDKIDVLKNIPVYVFHGEKDNNVPFDGTDSAKVPLGGAKELVKAIQDAGGNKIHFVPFANEGHMIWDKAITYDGLEEWLFAQVKN